MILRHFCSKYVELFDTVVLILRKKPVIFLHSYHHVVMLTVTWSWLDGKWIAGSWYFKKLLYFRLGILFLKECNVQILNSEFNQFFKVVRAG